MKTCGGVGVEIYVLFTSALDGEWSASCPGRLAPGTHCTRGWVSNRTGVYDVKRKFFILPGLELRPLGRPACSQLLYRLSYPGSYLLYLRIEIN
jgi:hypothetical protein